MARRSRRSRCVHESKPAWTNISLRWLGCHWATVRADHCRWVSTSLSLTCVLHSLTCCPFFCSGYGNELWRFDVEKTYERDGVSRDGQGVFELMGQYDGTSGIPVYVLSDVMPSPRCYATLWQDPSSTYIYGGKSANGEPTQSLPARSRLPDSCMYRAFVRLRGGSVEA